MKPTLQAVVRLGVIAGLGLSLAGCAVLARPFAWLSPERALEVRPVQTAAVAPPASRTDRLYEGAARDLQARNYGQALERLHMARESAPGDVRILNALGVTYDKLGRFDLSNRYYALALEAEPGSPVVLANLSYSARLQNAPAPRLALAAVAAPVAAAPAPTGFQLAQGSATLVRQTPLFVGQPVVIVDGSGVLQTAARTRSELVARGWSVAGEVQTAAAPRANGQIAYPPQHADAAQALARTLPFAVELSACIEACVGLRLTLGTNSTWTS